MDKNKSLILIIIIIVVLFLLVAGCIAGTVFLVSQSGTTPEDTPTTSLSFNMTKFKSDDDFISYIKESKDSYYAYGGMGAPTGDIMLEVSLEEDAGSTAPKSTPERVSETNVQVENIDEPDIVKTDGESIFVSNEYYYFHDDIIREPLLIESESEEILPQRTTATNIVKAFPPEDLEKSSDIDTTGNLLLADDILMIQGYDSLIGYDVSDPSDPEEKWDILLDEDTAVHDSRLYNDTLFLILRTNLYSINCPIKPVVIDNTDYVVNCTDIYFPSMNVAADVTYTVMKIDTSNGKVKDEVTFVGSWSDSIVYMSENSLYITYYEIMDYVSFTYDFLSKEASDLFPKDILDKIQKLQGYDISAESKLTELEQITDSYLRGLDKDERSRIENELTDRMDDYYTDHKRDLERTGIVKISTDKLTVEATGSIPGYPLNQFALDEYDDHLRMATTVGDRGFGMNSESANDVYVLDNNLDEVGSVLDLGLEERIYSARFIGDKGYLVTFRQIDPFYVLDLSDPTDPDLKGELKIPGYSSYLHPITDDLILGIGKEDANVKLSLFDVSKPSNPREQDKYMLDDYWSDILDTHHAFLLDDKHEIFFLPGSNEGYIFSYGNDKIELVKSVTGIQARRALYINDYLYIVGNDKIIVLDETNWERINELAL